MFRLLAIALLAMTAIPPAAADPAVHPTDFGCFGWACAYDGRFGAGSCASATPREDLTAVIVDDWWGRAGVAGYRSCWTDENGTRAYEMAGAGHRAWLVTHTETFVGYERRGASCALLVDVEAGDVDRGASAPCPRAPPPLAWGNLLP